MNGCTRLSLVAGPHTVRSIETLVIADMQNWVVDTFGVGPELLDRIAGVIASARERAVPVVYVRVAFRDGYPEIHPGNATWVGVSKLGCFTEADPATRIHPVIAPQDGDVVVTKRRVSAFAGSDLELVLRSRGVDHLTLAGVATSGVILSTTLQACDLDFGVTVLSDCCMDRDMDVHQMLVERVLARRATVLSSTDWHRKDP